MGGYGSGRYSGYNAKTPVESCSELDVNWMAREGIFDRGRRSGSIRWSNPWGEVAASLSYEVNTADHWLRLRYSLRRMQANLDYEVPLTTTSLPWGGMRWWFVCALNCDGQYCGRRVGKLYLPPSGRHYGCRHCYDLTYRSCQESGKFDTMWGWMAASTGIGADRGDVKRMMQEDAQWERRIRRQACRNEQRRRRRKDRGWA